MLGEEEGKWGEGGPLSILFLKILKCARSSDLAPSVGCDLQ